MVSQQQLHKPAVALFLLTEAHRDPAAGSTYLSSSSHVTTCPGIYHILQAVANLATAPTTELNIETQEVSVS